MRFLVILGLVMGLPSQSLVFEVRLGPAGLVRPQVADGRGRLLLVGDDGIHGMELFAVHLSGSPVLLDLLPGAMGSDPQVIWSGSDELFVAAKDASLVTRLWRVNSVDHAAMVVTGVVRDTHEMVQTGDAWVFRGDDGIHGSELWRTDGTALGTYMLRDLEPGPISGRPYAFVSNGSTAMLAQSQFSPVPWITDGVSAQRLINSNPNGVNNPGGFLPTGSQWLFAAHSPSTGYELWRSDGTPQGTQQILEINPGSTNGVEWSLIALGMGAVFLGRDPNVGIEPWFTDGTAAGTNNILDVNPGIASSMALIWPNVMAAGDSVWLTLTDGVHGIEPWITDSTGAGTRMVADIRAGGGASIVPFDGSRPPPMLAVGEDRTVVFVADTGTSGNEIWISDGTPAGTFPLPEILPGLASAEPQDFIRVGPNVFFTADDGIHGRELWAFPTSVTRAAVLETVSPPCNAGQSHPHITSQSLPAVGNPSFAIGVTDAPANAFAVLFASFGVQEQQISGCTFWPQIPASFAATVTSAAGTANLAVPIPALPFLAGVQLWAQWGVVELGGPVFSLVTPSDALFVQIGK